MISIGKILFFILMPLIYRLIQIIFLGNEDDKKQKIIRNTILLSTYYGIELIYILVLYFISKEWVFMKGALSQSGAFAVFVILSIFFIIVHLLVMSLTGDDGFSHLVVLILFFGFFLILESSNVQFYIDEKIFNEMPYNISNQYIINLKALSDTHTTDGKITGSRFYINGTIKDNYEIYYSFIDEKGSTVIRHFPYSEQHVEIYEMDDCENPRIEFTEYFKEYKDKKAAYTDYIVYIPTGTNNITIDME